MYYIFMQMYVHIKNIDRIQSAWVLDVQCEKSLGWYCISNRVIFLKWEGVETGWSWLRIGTGGGHL